ncbi:MAG: hypothetical protein JXK05_02600 [Campylobacterales bacterium]|nr:hypothetical protein [Campylobacterales bacterium]
MAPEFAHAEYERLNFYDYNSSSFTRETDGETKRMVLDKLNENIAGKALFVNGMFEGIVAQQSDAATTTTVILENANALEEIIDTFSVDVNASGLSNKRVRMPHGTIGTYDDINDQPLTYELRQKSRFNARTAQTEVEPTIRINFPKGYRMPLHTKPLDIYIPSSQKRGVNQTGTFIWTEHFDIDEDYKDDYVTITSDGSYIEFGLGTRLHVEGRTRKSDRYAAIAFDQNATFESNLQVEVTGHYEESWSDTITLTNAISISIPVSTLVAVKIAFTPELRVGGSGSIDGHLLAHSFTHRDGAFGINFDSRRSSGDKILTSSSFNANSNLLDQESVNVAIEAQGSVLLAPVLKITPSANIAGVMDVKFIELRGGIDVLATANGAIATGFEIINTAQGSVSSSHTSTSIGVHIGAFPWLSYEMDVVLDPVDIRTRFSDVVIKPIEIYDGDEKDLFRGNEIEIFDWNIALLNTPDIIVSYPLGQTYVGFIINIDALLLEHVKFYYTLDGSIPTENAAHLWDGIPFYLENNATVRVKAVMLGADSLTSHWNFGKSVSPTVSKSVVALPAIPATPTNVNATDTLKGSINVTWAGTIDTAEYDIYRSSTEQGTYTKVTTRTTTSYNESIPLGGSFYYKVKACNSAGYCSDFSASDRGEALTTLEIDPVDPNNGDQIDPPTTLSANAGADQYVALTAASVSVSFSAEGSLGLPAIVGYEWRITGPGGYMVSNNHSFSTNFVAGVYELELTVRNSNGDTDTDSVMLYVREIPDAPVVTATNAFNSVHLEWNNISNVSYYEIYSDTNADGFYYWTAEVPQPEGALIPLYSTYDHSVSDDLFHYYKVRACDVKIDKCSDFSKIVSAKRNAALTFQ